MAPIKQPATWQTLKFYKFKRYEAYFVILLDLGVNGDPLLLGPKVFAPHEDGTGGCNVDSGSSVSHTIEPAYQILVNHLVDYFSRLPEFTRVTRQTDKLCYKTSTEQGFINIPSVSFYFEGARLDVSPQGTFSRELKRGKEVFCLEIQPDNSLTTLAAYQLANYKFIYDNNLKELQFGAEDSARNG